MKTLATVGAIASMMFTAGSALTMWVFAAASLANNTSDASYKRVKLWVINFSLLSLIGIGAGIWLLVKKRQTLASSVSLLPAAAMFIAFVWQIIRPS
jgi:hypothetical protein